MRFDAQLGNTYPFTEDDWTTTFDLAEDTGLCVAERSRAGLCF